MSVKMDFLFCLGNCKTKFFFCLVHKNSQTKNIGLKKIEVSRKTVLGNVVRKLHTKFHRASLIRRRFKIQETRSLTIKQKILFLERFYIFQSRVTFTNTVFGNIIVLLRRICK